MNKLLRQIEQIERLDQLIRFRSTGTPKNLAKRMKISEASLYRLIDTMKDMGAPIEFSIYYQSYIYASDVNFKCGFFHKELSLQEAQNINGGFVNLARLVIF